MENTEMTNENDDSIFRSFHGKRYNVEGNDYDGQVEEEQNPVLKAQNDDLEFSQENEREKFASKEQFKSGGNGHNKQDKKGNNEDIKAHTVYKYNTHIPLAEEIRLGNDSKFLQIIEDKPKISSKIDLSKEKGIILVPHESETSPVVIPYSFKDITEIEYYIKLASEKSIDDLFLMSESIWSKILVAKPEVITFFVVDTLYSYFQDLFPTTHYDMIIGHPGAGKGAILVSFKLQGYRAVMAAGMSGANLLELLGSVEACQVTLLEDEFQNIESDPDKEVIYKIGYDETNLVPKTLDGSKSNRHNRWYHPYCLKLFASEKEPNSDNLGGFNDRTFRMKSLKGKPRILVKNILHEFNKSEDKRDPNYKEIISRITTLRKLLLIYRLLHHSDIIEEVCLNIDGRALELTSPQIRLFNSEKLVSKEENKRVLHKKILPALSKFLKEKGEISEKTIDGVVYQALQDLFVSNSPENTLDPNNETRTKYTLTYEDIVDRVKILIDGETDLYRRQTISSLEYGEITHNQILKTCRERFSETKKYVYVGTGEHTKKALEFYKEDVDKAGKSFDVITEIKIIEKQPEESSSILEDKELWEGCIVASSQS